MVDDREAVGYVETDAYGTNLHVNQNELGCYDFCGEARQEGDFGSGKSVRVSCPERDPRCEAYVWSSSRCWSERNALEFEIAESRLCEWGMKVNAMSGTEVGWAYHDLGRLFELEVALDGIPLQGIIRIDEYGTNRYFDRASLGCP